MSRLIAKDGKLCIVGGRLVTDAGGAPCVCGDGPPPVDGTGCVMILTPCATTNPAEDLFAIAFSEFPSTTWAELSAARVIYWEGFGCFAVVGFLVLGPDEPLPDNVAFLFALQPGGSPLPTAYYDDCTEGPCGVVDPDCGVCVLPNRCLQPNPFNPDPWAIFGFGVRLCARGALMVTRVNWSHSFRFDRVTSTNQNEFEIERIANLSAESRTEFRVDNSTSANPIVHSYTAVGNFRNFNRQGSTVVTDQNQSLNLSDANITVPNYTGTYSIALNPFRNMSNTHARAVVPFSAFDAECFAPDILNAPSIPNLEWAERVFQGNYTNAWNWNLTPSPQGSCFRITGSSSVSSLATIQPLWGGATFEYTANKNSVDRRDESLGPGCVGGNWSTKTTTASVSLTESRQVFWYRDGSTLPDIRPGCPLTVLAVACDDVNDRTVVDVSGLIPLPFGVLLARDGGERCYGLLPIIQDSDAPETAVGIIQNCEDVRCGSTPEATATIRALKAAGQKAQTDGDRMLAAMGFDPEEERRKLLNGGDCGCSPQAGFYT